jgi:phosphoribosylanthranilate isomerase
MTKIKICGITNLEDALQALELGADALGFVFAPSPRKILPEEAKKIIEKLPPLVVKVGVFVNQDRPWVKEQISRCNLDLLQLHGEETPEYCLFFHPLPVVKSFRIKDESSLEQIPPYLSAVKAFLLDTAGEGKPGGTGKVFRWELALEVQKLGKPVILAGGLNPENVRAAITMVRPYAVDVSSGVETSPGKKDYNKLRQFIQQVRKTDECR